MIHHRQTDTDWTKQERRSTHHCYIHHETVSYYYTIILYRYRYRYHLVLIIITDIQQINRNKENEFAFLCRSGDDEGNTVCTAQWTQAHANTLKKRISSSTVRH
jgi:hypothetical protein